jgi:hypothetical protein
MRTLAKTAVALGFLGATAIGTTATVQAQGYYGYGYYPHPYYHPHTNDITATTAVAGSAHGTAARRIGLFRAAFVSPIAMVRGTSMEGGRATTDINVWRPLRRPLFF